MIRRIKKILKSKPTIEGAGVYLKRAFGFYHVPQLDPFLLLDDFRSVFHPSPEEKTPPSLCVLCGHIAQAR